MDTNNTPKRKLGMISQTLKKSDYYSDKHIINITELPPEKLLSSPIVTSRIVNRQVFINLADSCSSKENECPNNGFKTLKLSDESNMYIQMIETRRDENPVSSATFQSLARRGITVTPTRSSNKIPKGKFIKFQNEDEIVGPIIIENWFKCQNCPGYFIKKLDLTNHEIAHHSNQRNHNFVIPVVDLSKDESRDKLTSLGINDYLTITNMNESDGRSSLGIPIISLQGSANITLCNILAMGAYGILPSGSFNEICK